MRQQINLYQPIFRAQHKLFSARTVGSGLLAVIVTLGAIFGYASWQVRALATQVERLRAEQQATDARMTSLGALQGARANTKSIDDRIAALNVELALRSRALQALQSGAAGESNGFASRFEALARGHIDGLWLDHVVLGSGRGGMSLSGGTLDPALVPRYLHGLAGEQALAGARFDEFLIEGADKVGNAVADAQAKTPETSAVPGALRFRASSSSLSAAKEAT